MQAAIPFPDISPEIFTIAIGNFQFALRWYALAYIAGLVIAWRLVVAAVKRPALWPANTAPMTPDQVEGLLTWVILGVILGGRLGFVLFYQPGYYLAHPTEILMVWRGGMSFHGGFLGVILAAVLYCRSQHLPMLQVGDAITMSTPPGLLLGRLANFVNGELWGRPSDMPWAVIFNDPRAKICDGTVGVIEDMFETLCARHPSQLYEASMEGLILGTVLLWLAWRRGGFKAPGQVTGVFVAGYGTARFIVEFFRQPDAQFITPDYPLGHALSLAPSVGLTMGQLLSLPMLLVGVAMIVIARRRAA